jgi:chromosome segregation ATPase
MSSQNPRDRAPSRRVGVNARLAKTWGFRLAPDALRGLSGGASSRGVLPGLDAAYRRQLKALSRVRRAVAAVATSRKQLQLQIWELEQQLDRQSGAIGGAPEASEDRRSHGGRSDRSATDRLAELHRQHSVRQADEERVFAASRRLQEKMDAFRIAKEAAENAYSALEQAARTTLAEIAKDDSASHAPVP